MSILYDMKLIATAIVAGALIIALAIMATRSDPAPAAEVDPSNWEWESTCLMQGGTWIDGETDAPTDGDCIFP